MDEKHTLDTVVKQDSSYSPAVTGTWQMPDVNCRSAGPRETGAESRVPTRLGRGPLRLSELQPLLVDLCARQELVLRGLRAGVPLHQPQAPLGHEPDHVRPVHVAQVVALLVQHVNDALVDFSPNATESRLVLFFLCPLILGVFSAKSFCVNEAGRSWGQLCGRQPL